jgi:hypothetical protein
MDKVELRQSIIRMIWITTGTASPESVDARVRATALAEKSGNLSELVSLMHASGNAAFQAGDYESAATLADQALELAVREGNPTNLGHVYGLQVIVRFLRGDLARSSPILDRKSLNDKHFGLFRVYSVVM